MKKYNILLILVTLLISCNFQSQEKDSINQPSDSSANRAKFYNTKEQLDKKKFHLLLGELDAMKLPLINNEINEYVKLIEGEYYIDTIITKEKTSNYFELFDNEESNAIVNNTKYNNLFNNTTSITDNFLYKIRKKTYFPLASFKFNNYTLIGSFVQFFGENDIPGVFYIITSFNKDGRQIDYLILYCRFNFETMIIYNFKCDRKFSNIVVEDIEEDWTLYNDLGDIIGEKEIPELIEHSKLYEVDNNGFFKEK